MTLHEWLELEKDASGEFVDGHLMEEEVPDMTHELGQLANSSYFVESSQILLQILREETG